MPDTPITIPSAQGTTFTFGSVSFRAKAYDSSESVPTIDTTDCSQPEGDLPRLQPAPISDPTEVNLECWGNTPPTKGTIDVLTCSKLGLSGVRAICTKVTRKGEAKGLLNFTASFSVIAAD